MERTLEEEPPAGCVSGGVPDEVKRQNDQVHLPSGTRPPDLTDGDGFSLRSAWIRCNASLASWLLYLVKGFSETFLYIHVVGGIWLIEIQKWCKFTSEVCLRGCLENSLPIELK